MKRISFTISNIKNVRLTTIITLCLFVVILSNCVHLFRLLLVILAILLVSYPCPVHSLVINNISFKGMKLQLNSFDSFNKLIQRLYFYFTLQVALLRNIFQLRQIRINHSLLYFLMILSIKVHNLTFISILYLVFNHFNGRIQINIPSIYQSNIRIYFTHVLL